MKNEKCREKKTRSKRSKAAVEFPVYARLRRFGLGLTDELRLIFSEINENAVIDRLVDIFGTYFVLADNLLKISGAG